MRYRLRTLLIVLALGPVLAWVAWLIYRQWQHEEELWRRTIETCM